MSQTRAIVSVVCCLLLLAPQAASAQGTGRYALLIGAKEWDDTRLGPLDYTENDVAVLAEVLKDGGYRKVTLLTTSSGAFEPRNLPTAANIRRELKALAEKRTKNDMILLAFAGHGVEFIDTDEPYLCPKDANLSDRRTMISINEVYKTLGNSEARFKLLLSDACRNDPGKKRKLPKFTQQKPPKNVVALFGCSDGESAFESPAVKHGIFFHFLIQGMRGKATLGDSKQVTLGALTDYVQREVPNYVKKEIDANSDQSPEQVGRFSGGITLFDVTERVLKGDQEKRVVRFTDAVREASKLHNQTALSLVDLSLKDNPQHVDSLVLRAHLLEGMNKFDAALTAADKALELDPERSYPHVTRGRIFLARKEYDLAVGELSKAIEKSDRAVRALYLRGRVYLRMGKQEEARGDFESAIKLDAKYEPAVTARGLVLANQGQIKEAIADFTRAIAINKNYTPAYIERAALYAQQNQPEKALADYNAAVRTIVKTTEPAERVRAYAERGRLHEKLKDDDKAISDYTSALELAPGENKVRIARAKTHMRKKAFAAAVKDFDEVLKRDSKNHQVFNFRGVCQGQLGKWSPALTDFNRAIELDGANATYYENRAEIYRRQKQPDKAKADLDMAKKLKGS